MKQIVMFIQQSCPYCKQALAWQKQIISENPELQRLDIEIVDELRERERANSYDYYYVPTYYVGGEKVHEGAATKEKVEQALRKGLKN